MRAGRTRAVLAAAVAALVLGGALAAVVVARVRAGRAPLVFSFPWKYPESIALSRDGRWLAVVDGGSGLFVWRVEAGAERREVLDRGHVVRRAGFEPDDDTLVMVDDARIRRAKLGEGELRDETVFVWSAAVEGELSPDAARAVGFVPGHLPEVVDLRASFTPRTLAAVPADLRDARQLGWTPSGSYVWWERSGDERLRVWSAREGTLVVEGKSPPFLLGLLDPGDRSLELAGDTEAFLVVREIATGRELQRFHVEAPGGPWACRPAITEDGELLAVGSRRIHVYALRTGELVANFDAPAGTEQPCHRLAFDGTGEHLASLWDGKATVWRVPR